MNNNHVLDGRHRNAALIGRAMLACCVLALGGSLDCFRLPAAAQGPKETKVSAPTRIDWKFAAAGFGGEALQLPKDFDSTQQRYQLYVPKKYTKDKAWPLVAFISPGDGPVGWSAWQKACETRGMFFCSPFKAGNNVAAGQRIRIVLDMLDDVRRHYRIDPDQTCLGGLSGGGRVSCTIGFALPEYFGGVIPVCGTNTLPSLAYLRHRIHDRLSVAFVTGTTDFNRKENEEYMYPYFQELGIRSKLWVPAVGHTLPPASVVEEVHAWLAEDLKRRAKNAEDYPGLSVTPDSAPTAQEQARTMLTTALADLKQPPRVWRGVTLLQGVVARWGSAPTGKEARAQLMKVSNDEALLQRVGEQGAEDEVRFLTAQAKAFERFGLTAKAIEAWELLARNYADSAAGQKAAAEVRRLRK